MCHFHHYESVSQGGTWLGHRNVECLEHQKCSKVVDRKSLQMFCLQDTGTAKHRSFTKQMSVFRFSPFVSHCGMRRCTMAESPWVLSPWFRSKRIQGMVFLRQEHILWFMIRNIWFDSGFNAKTHSLKTPQLLKHMMFRGISLLCLVMLLRAKEHCVVALVRKSHGETGSWPFSQSLRWCSHIHHKLVHGFCHWYHLHISNLLCFLNSKGLSSQICPSFLIPENLLLYFTAQMDELFSGILVGSQKTEAGFDPESTDAEDGGSSEKKQVFDYNRASWEIYCGENLAIYSFKYKSHWQHG